MAKGPNLTEEQQGRILKLLLEDQVEPQAIAKRLGITRGAIYKLAKKVGLRAEQGKSWSERNSGASIESKSRVN